MRHRLARQRAFDEDRLAVDARDAAPFLVERNDVRDRAGADGSGARRARAAEALSAGERIADMARDFTRRGGAQRSFDRSSRISPMRILALDTSTEWCSVAVGDGRHWHRLDELARQAHSERAAADGAAALADVGWTLERSRRHRLRRGPGLVHRRSHRLRRRAGARARRRSARAARRHARGARPGGAPHAWLAKRPRVASMRGCAKCTSPRTRASMTHGGNRCRAAGDAAGRRSPAIRSARSGAAPATASRPIRRSRRDSRWRGRRRCAPDRAIDRRACACRGSRPERA